MKAHYELIEGVESTEKPSEMSTYGANGIDINFNVRTKTVSNSSEEGPKTTTLFVYDVKRYLSAADYIVDKAVGVI